MAKYSLIVLLFFYFIALMLRNPKSLFISKVSPLFSASKLNSGPRTLLLPMIPFTELNKTLIRVGTQMACLNRKEIPPKNLVEANPIDLNQSNIDTPLVYAIRMKTNGGFPSPKHMKYASSSLSSLTEKFNLSATEPITQLCKHFKALQYNASCTKALSWLKLREPQDEENHQNVKFASPTLDEDQWCTNNNTTMKMQHKYYEPFEGISISKAQLERSLHNWRHKSLSYEKFSPFTHLIFMKTTITTTQCPIYVTYVNHR
jgi:hypothetical protein